MKHDKITEGYMPYLEHRPITGDYCRWEAAEWKAPLIFCSYRGPVTQAISWREVLDNLVTTMPGWSWCTPDWLWYSLSRTASGTVDQDRSGWMVRRFKSAPWLEYQAHQWPVLGRDDGIAYAIERKPKGIRVSSYIQQVNSQAAVWEKEGLCRIKWCPRDVGRYNYALTTERFHRRGFIDAAVGIHMDRYCNYWLADARMLHQTEKSTLWVTYMDGDLSNSRRQEHEGFRNIPTGFGEIQSSPLIRQRHIRSVFSSCCQDALADGSIQLKRDSVGECQTYLFQTDMMITAKNSSNGWTGTWLARLMTFDCIKETFI